MIFLILGATLFVIALLTKNVSRIRRAAHQHALNMQFVHRHWWRLVAISALPAYFAVMLLLGPSLMFVISTLAVIGLVVTIRAFSYWPRRSPIDRSRQWMTPSGKEFDPYAKH